MYFHSMALGPPGAGLSHCPLCTSWAHASHSISPRGKRPRARRCTRAAQAARALTNRRRGTIQGVERGLSEGRWCRVERGGGGDEAACSSGSLRVSGGCVGRGGDGKVAWLSCDSNGAHELRGHLNAVRVVMVEKEVVSFYSCVQLRYIPRSCSDRLVVVARYLTRFPTAPPVGRTLVVLCQGQLLQRLVVMLLFAFLIVVVVVVVVMGVQKPQKCSVYK